MLIVMFRVVILFSLVFLVMRMMGKRQIGQLQPYELAVAIMVSALAAFPMEDISIPLINSIVPILLILSMQVAVSVLSLKHKGVRGILCGKPSVVIQNGKFIQSELERQRLNINDLLEQLRICGYHNLSDVEFAILETTGQISIIPKSQKRAVLTEDLQLDTEYEGISYALVVDGEIEKENLQKIGVTEKWLRNELAKFGIDDIKDVFLASLDTGGKLFFQTKEK